MMDGSLEVDRVIPDPLIVPDRFETSEDCLAPARGIMVGLALSLPIWLMLSCGAYFLLH
jgi:hypothetical protein